MRYAINLNLDHEAFPQELVKTLFREIRKGFVAAGFRCDGRLFTVDLPGDEARDLARKVVERVGAEVGLDDLSGYVKEFYGFDLEAAVNLLLPPAGAITVEELGEITELEQIELSAPGG